MGEEKRDLDQHHSIQSLGEEIANTVTHGIGAGLAIAGLAVAVVVAVQYGDVFSVVGATIFGGSLVLLYMASTIFHALQRQTVHARVRRFFHIFDHIGIAFLIAGTYTPIVLKVRGVVGWTLLVVVWALAITIALIKAFFTGRFNGLTAMAYVALGWLGLFFIRTVVQNFGMGTVWWIFLGGLAYTLGVIPFLWERLPFNHAIWHIFVMLGSVCHFFGIIFHVLPVT